MKQTTRALRALSPKRNRHPHGEGDSDSDGAASPTHSGGSPSFLSIGSRRGSRSKQRPRRRRSSAQHELPELERSDADFYRDWGITRERESILLVEFRRHLEEATGGPLKPMFDRYYLRRFLRARQHDLKRAQAMFLAHLKWRADNDIDSILTDWNFPERDAFLTLYPQGYHKTDKMGRPVYIQHIGAIKVKQLAEITTEDRMIRYNVQEYERCLKYIFPCCSKKAGRHIDQTLAIMDVKGVGLKHLTGEVKSIMSRITSTASDNYPETLGKTVIINAPTVFKMIWSMVRPMLDARTQGKIEVAPSDYMKLLRQLVDDDCIPEYLGGKSKGSLLDDVGPWKDPSLVALVEADIARRDQLGSATLDDGMLSGDSQDLDHGASSDVTPHAPPSPGPSGGSWNAAMAAAAQQQQQQGAAAMEGQASSKGPPESPFQQPVSGRFTQQQQQQQQQQQSPMTSGSELDDFQDARSRRLSILSSGSSAYLSAGEDDSEFFTPKHGDAVQASGPSFQSDRPLLSPSAPVSPEVSPDGKPPGAAAPSQQQQQQQQRPAKYSDQHLPSPEAAAAGRGGRPPAILVPGEAEANGGFDTPSSSGALSPPKQQQPLQIPILARVRALEEKLPEVERGLRRHLPPGGDLPSKSVGQGTLLSRVQALEHAMDTLLQAQDTVLSQQRQRGGGGGGGAADETRGCCSGCTIM